jgi:hypothetical protein
MENVKNANSKATETWIAYLPMIIIQLYLWMTVALFTWGPWIWEVNNSILFYGYLTAAHLSLGLGYLFGVRHTGRAVYSGPHFSTLLNFGIIITLLVFLPTLRFRTGAWLPNLNLALNAPGEAYLLSATARYTSGTAPFIEYLRFFLGPILVLPIPIGVYYFSIISTKQRIGLFASLISIITLFIAMGTNKAIADSLAMIVMILIAAWASKRINFNIRIIATVLAAVGFCAFAFFYFFTSGMLSRGGGAVPTGNIPAIEAKADFDSPLIRNLDPVDQVGVLGLSLYLSGGYQALAIALEEPWVPCFGVGNSMFMTRQCDRLLGTDIAARTYPERIFRKSGFDTQTFFVSIYPWLASDVSFIGTIPIIYLIGLLFGKVWADTLMGVNPFSIVLFGMLTLMFFYFPATNQMLQDGEGVSAFIVTFWLWLSSRQPFENKTNQTCHTTDSAGYKE